MQTREACLTFPLVPQHAGTATPAATTTHGAPHGSNTAPAAVTLQQLQLVTRSLDQDRERHTLSGVLLLSLLLQRADAGVRAQFLGSPWGSYFLEVLGTVPQWEQPSGTDTSLPITVPCDDPGMALAELKETLQWQFPGDVWEQLPAVTASLLALAWAHLQVQEGSELRENPMLGPQQWSVLATQRRAANLRATPIHGADLPGKHNAPDH
jgi:hypothetical protein